MNEKHISHLTGMVQLYKGINKDWAFFIQKGTVSTNKGSILFCENFLVEAPKALAEIKTGIKEGRGRIIAPIVEILVEEMKITLDLYNGNRPIFDSADEAHKPNKTAKKISINEILSRPPLRISERVAERLASIIDRPPELHKEVYSLTTGFLNQVYYYQSYLLPTTKKHMRVRGQPESPPVLLDLLTGKIGVKKAKKIYDSLLKTLQEAIFNDNPLLKNEKEELIATDFYGHFKWWQGLLYILTEEGKYLEHMRRKKWCEIMQNTFKLDCNENTFKRDIIKNMGKDCYKAYTKVFKNLLTL